MREIKWAVSIAVLGASAVAWSYSNFVSKDTFSLLLERLERIEKKIDNITN